MRKALSKINVRFLAFAAIAAWCADVEGVLRSSESLVSAYERFLPLHEVTRLAGVAISESGPTILALRLSQAPLVDSFLCNAIVGLMRISCALSRGATSAGAGWMGGRRFG